MSQARKYNVGEIAIVRLSVNEIDMIGNVTPSLKYEFVC